MCRLYRWRISNGKAALMPIGIWQLSRAGGIEFGDLVRGEFPADRAEIGAELLFITCANDERGNGGALEKPVEGDLGDRFAGFFGDFIDDINDFEEVIVR